MSHQTGITILTPEKLPLFTPSGENPYIKAPNSYSYPCLETVVKFRLIFSASAQKLKDGKTQGISKNSTIFIKLKAKFRKTQFF